MVCLEWAWSGEFFFSQYCIGSLWGQMCCSLIDGKLKLNHASAAKKRIKPHPTYLSTSKICMVELCTELFYAIAIIPTLFLCFLLICYAYISLHFLMFCILVVLHIFYKLTLCNRNTKRTFLFRPICLNLLFS